MSRGKAVSCLSCLGSPAVVMVILQLIILF